MNFIPCENCNRHVEFERYLEHLESCVEVPNFFFRTSNIIGSNLNLPIDFITNFNSFFSINIVLPEIIPEDLEDVEVGVDNISDVLKDYERKENVCDFCVICQNNLNDVDDVKFSITLCNHVYCNPCIENWFKKSKKCPICLLDVVDLLSKKKESIN